MFPLPLLTSDDPQDSPFGPIWSLQHRYGFRCVPPEPVAADWQSIVRGWERLDVQAKGCTVEILVSCFQGRHKSLVDLAEGRGWTEETAVAWLRDLLAVMADYYDRHQQLPPQALLTGIFPDQHGVFRSPHQLARDQGIDEELKDIAQTLDPGGQLSPSRAQLLHQGLAEGSNSDTVSRFLNAIVQRELTQEKAIDVLVAEVAKLLSSKTKRAETDPVLLVSIDLLSWFAEHPERYRAHARCIPFLTREGTLQVTEDEPAFLLPSSQWDQRAEPYQAVFPRRRVLSEVYARGEDTRAAGGLLSALVTWQITRSDLLESAPYDLESHGVAALLAEPSVNADHKVRGLVCSTLPFLDEILGAAAQDRQRARLLLELILRFVIHQDTRWREPVAWPCACGAHPAVALRLYPAEWLAALRVRNWIASEPDEHRKVWSRPASPETLNDLVNWPEALADDLQVQFLVRLGFDALELNIRRQASGSEESAQHLRQQLAHVVAAFGSKPESYANLISVAQERARFQEMVRRNQLLGLHVQGLVKQVLQEVGFDWVVVRHQGRDLDAHLDSDLGAIDVGPFFFEVKTTQGDEVKMSPAQAEFAVKQLHRANCVLCVVDLQDVKLPEDLTALDATIIEPCVFILDNIGQILMAAYQSVLRAGSGTDEVRVENLENVHYCVQRKVWEWAPRLREWVGTVKDRPVPDQSGVTVLP